MGEIKTITKIPVGAVALMGAAICAVLGLIYGIIVAVDIGVAALTLPSLIPGGALGAVPLLSAA